MTRRQLLLARIVFVLYLIAVAWLCFGHFESTPDVPRGFFGIPIDKIVHFIMFFPYPVLAYFAFNRFTAKWWTSLLCILATFVSGALIAAGTEIGQARLTTYRSGDPNDWKADILAIGVSCVVVVILYLFKQRKKECANS
jgi:hypothetical protein